MITILHGDDIVKSRLALEEIKKQNQKAEILNLNGKKIDLTQLKQALEAISMFSDQRLVVIENLLGNKQGELIAYLQDNLPKSDLVLWEGKEISKSFLSKIPQAKIFLFKPEPVLFKFLESIKPDNKEEELKLLELSLKKEAPEIIFHMLTRQLRLLMLLREGINSGIEELDRLASWQKERLTRQAKYFTLGQLVDIYHQLLEIDLQQKSGQAAFNLPKTLELFVANL